MLRRRISSKFVLPHLRAKPFQYCCSTAFSFRCFSETPNEPPQSNASDESATAFAVPVESEASNLTSLAALPTTPDVFQLGLLEHFSGSIIEQVDRVHEAYNNYFDHIRFRNKWAEPGFKKSTVQVLFREAAEHVIRIRCFLDKQSPETKLRLIDGNAQHWLHTDESKQLVNFQNQFVCRLVHETFREANGKYVEGLTPQKLNDYLVELMHHRFNPKQHLLHVILQSHQLLSSVRMKHELGITNPEDVPPLRRDNDFYVDEDSVEDEYWREAIGRYYSALESLERVVNLKKNPEKARAKKQ